MESLIRRQLLLAACTLILAGCGNGAMSHLVPNTAGRSGGNSTTVSNGAFNPNIKNVVVVILENRSFDNMFQFLDHNYANIADISATGAVHSAAYSGNEPTNHGTPVTLSSQTLAASSTDVGHSHSNFLQDYDGGADDGWTGIGYGYVPKSEVQPDLDIANEFAISDNFFHGITAPTFPSHVEIGGSSTYGVIDNPSDQIWGCDAAPGTTTGLFDPNAPGEEDPTGGPFPCFDELSIFDLLDRAQPAPVSWKFYSEPMGYSAAGNEEIPGYYRQIRYGPDWNNNIEDSDTLLATAFADSVGTCSLAQVSESIPNEASTDHAGTPSLGPMYLEALVNAFGESACFDNTLMIITWDDWGGWYDHVTPPTRPNGTHLSFRKPIIFVGGYVKKGPIVNGAQEAYVTHVLTEDASINKTIENLYGLGTLGADDVNANDFRDVLMPANATPAPFVPITSAELAAVPLPSPASPLPINAVPRPHRKQSRPLFRIVPPNFAGGKDVRGKTFDADDDYYGKQSADY